MDSRPSPQTGGLVGKHAPVPVPVPDYARSDDVAAHAWGASPCIGLQTEIPSARTGRSLDHTHTHTPPHTRTFASRRPTDSKWAWAGWLTECAPDCAANWLRVCVRACARCPQRELAVVSLTGRPNFTAGWHLSTTYRRHPVDHSLGRPPCFFHLKQDTHAKLGVGVR